MSGLRQFAADEEQSRLEIMTAAGSPLHEYLRRGVDAQFVEIIQSNGGQLLKILNPASFLDRLNESQMCELQSVKAIETQEGLHLGIGIAGSENFSSGLSIPDRQLPGVLSGFLAGTLGPQVPPRAGDRDSISLASLHDQTPFIYQGDNY
jgi:hypothetical protein